MFDGYDELYVITFSSGLDFTSSLISKFKYAEVVYGCERIIGNDLSSVLALETGLVECFTKSKSAKMMSGRVSEGSLKLYVSREMVSHV